MTPVGTDSGHRRLAMLAGSGSGANGMQKRTPRQFSEQRRPPKDRRRLLLLLR